MTYEEYEKCLAEIRYLRCEGLISYEEWREMYDIYALEYECQFL